MTNVISITLIRRMDAILNDPNFYDQILGSFQDKLKRGLRGGSSKEFLTEDEEAFERLMRLAYLNGCKKNELAYVWLIQNGYVKCALTDKAKVELAKERV